MLIQTDIKELGDKRLNPDEAVVKEREELLALESKKKLPGQAEMEDMERAGGPRIIWTNLLRRLQKLNPDLHPRDGMEGHIALYVKKKAWEYTDGDKYGELPPNGQFFIDHKYVTGFPKQPIPEWSTVTLDTSQVAVREQRSWRSTLLSCIKAAVITYDQAISEFGDPIHDKRAYRKGGWFDQIQAYREKIWNSRHSN